MRHIPKTIDGLPVLFWTAIDKRHIRTVNGVHFNLSADKKVSVPSFLAIGGFYEMGFNLFYLDHKYKTITNTWYENLEKAFDQAEFEFPGVIETWEETD